MQASNNEYVSYFYTLFPSVTQKTSIPENFLKCLICGISLWPINKDNSKSFCNWVWKVITTILCLIARVRLFAFFIPSIQLFAEMKLATEQMKNFTALKINTPLFNLRFIRIFSICFTLAINKNSILYY